MNKRVKWVLSVVLFGLWLPACDAVIGIEEAQLDPLSGDLCTLYCAATQANCVDENAIYVSASLCTETCKLLPPGSPGDTDVNTVQCRLTQARSAKDTGEPAVHCPAAGPGGNGRCGTNCEGYCLLLRDVCGAQFEGFANLDQCINNCEMTIPSVGTFDASDTLGNSIQCRLYHMTAAAIDADEHCPHANGDLKCVDGTGGAGGNMSSSGAGGAGGGNSVGAGGA